MKQGVWWLERENNNPSSSSKKKNETFAERMALNPIGRCGGAPIFISTSAASVGLKPEDCEYRYDISLCWFIYSQSTVENGFCFHRWTGCRDSGLSGKDGEYTLLCMVDA